MAHCGPRGVAQSHGPQTIPVVAASPQSQWNKTRRSRDDWQPQNIIDTRFYAPKTLKQPATDPKTLKQPATDPKTLKQPATEYSKEDIQQALLILRDVRVRVARLQAEIMEAERSSEDSSSRMAVDCDVDKQEEETQQQQHKSLTHVQCSAEDYQTQDKAQLGLQQAVKDAQPCPKPSDSIAGTSQGISNGVVVQDEALQRGLQEMGSMAEVDVYKLPLPTFTGRNQDEYMTFRKQFDQYVSAMSVPDSHKLELLLQVCLNEEVKMVLMECCELGPIAGYERALYKLKERFIPKFLTAVDWMRSVVEGPSINGNNAKALKSFADSIRLSVNSIDVLQMTKEMDMNQYVPDIACRLTGKASEEYENEVSEYWKHYGTSPGIEWLLVFLMKVRQELLQGDTQPERQDIQKGAMSCQKQNTLTSCPLCQNPHVLPHCPTFQGMAVKERRTTLKRLQCCFSCLSASHTYAECKKKSICSMEGCRIRQSMWLHNHKALLERRNLAHSRTKPYRYGYQNCDYENWCQPDHNYSGRETSLQEWRSRGQEECSPY